MPDPTTPPDWWSVASLLALPQPARLCSAPADDGEIEREGPGNANLSGLPAGTLPLPSVLHWTRIAGIVARRINC